MVIFHLTRNCYGQRPPHLLQRNDVCPTYKAGLPGLFVDPAEEEEVADPEARKEEQAEREKEILPGLDVPQNEENYKFNEIIYPFQTASILRGPDLFIREDHTAPLIHMGIFFPGGRLFETKDNAGITKLLTSLISHGNDEAGASHFNRQLEIYGSRIQPMVADDYFGFYFSRVFMTVCT